MHVVRKPGDEQRVDERGGRRHAHRLAVETRAAAALGREELLAIGIVDRGDFGLAVDLERQRGAEDRQPVRVVGGAVERIEDPAEPGRHGPAPPISSARIWWSGNRSAISARNIRSTSTSTSVTRSIVPFLSTRTPDRSVTSWMSPARTTASMAVARKAGSGRHDAAGVGRATRFTIQISMPPSGARCSGDVVHEVADEEDAAAARLEEVLGREGIGDCLRDRSPRPGRARGRSSSGRSPARSRTRRRRAWLRRAGCRA